MVAGAYFDFLNWPATLKIVARNFLLAIRDHPIAPQSPWQNGQAE
jgi:hypothetical protein